MGVVVAFIIILAWGFHLFYILMNVTIAIDNPWMYFHLVVQIHLFTGLFITAHDAMHMSVSKNEKLNRGIGYLVTFLYAAMDYSKLKKKHFDHHRYAGTSKDPDFYHRNRFFPWWFSFMKQYITIWQFLTMAVLFNLLLLWFNEAELIILWIIPSILSTFQLFYFGTYLPHKQPHTNLDSQHKARSQTKNHLWAFLSCYFFGYHLEHHQHPGTAWWKLYRQKK